MKLSSDFRLKFESPNLRFFNSNKDLINKRFILGSTKILGHKDIKNTMVYIQYEQIAYGVIDDQFHVKVVDNVEEACKLVETGFEYVTGEYEDGGKIFRKRK